MSKYDKYFETEEGMSSCRICFVQIASSRRSGTSGLRRHLQRYHLDEFEELLNADRRLNSHVFGESYLVKEKVEKHTVDIIIKFDMKLFSKIHAALVARGFPASCFASNVEQMADERGFSCVRCYNPVRCKNKKVNNKAFCGYFSIEEGSVGLFLQELINVGVKKIHSAENFEELTKELVICCDTCKTEMGFMEPQPLGHFVDNLPPTTSTSTTTTNPTAIKISKEAPIKVTKPITLEDLQKIKQDPDCDIMTMLEVDEDSNDINDNCDMFEMSQDGSEFQSFMTSGMEEDYYEQNARLPSTSGISYSNGQALYPVATISRMLPKKKPITPVNVNMLKDVKRQPYSPPPPSSRIQKPPKSWCRCKVCKRILGTRGKDIYRMKSLKSSHARNHTSKPQFACLHCSYGCRFSGGMTLHMAREHSGLPAAYVDRSREKWYRDEVANIVKTCFTGPEDE